MLEVIRSMAEFDFYTVSIETDYQDLVLRVASDLDLDVELGYPKFGYEKAVHLVRGSTCRCWSCWLRNIQSRIQ